MGTAVKEKRKQIQFVSLKAVQRGVEIVCIISGARISAFNVFPFEVCDNPF